MKDKPREGSPSYIDMDFMVSNSNRSYRRRPWQKSMDSQEFGFTSNLRNSIEVAPADELFFKGQLLPLQMDHRLHLVQALSCEKGSTQGPSCEQGLQREISVASWWKDKKFHSCRMEGEMGLDDKASTSGQAPLYEQGGSSLSLGSCKDEEIKGPRLSNWCKNEDVIFSSCRIEGDVDLDYKEGMGNVMMDLRSSSFRSQNSGFWESGVDKDTGDSSSSRDSNGSSQDSYTPKNTKHETPSCASHHPHTMPSINIPWKSLFKRAAAKRRNYSSLPISSMGYSEDLSKYKECSAPSLKEAKEAILSCCKLDSVANEQRSRNIQGKQGQGKGLSSRYDGSESGFQSKSSLTDAAEGDTSAKKSTATSRSLLIKGNGGRVDGNEEMKRKKRSANVKEGYVWSLRPLYVMKKGLMDMDFSCGKRACDVESDNIYATRTGSMQRRLLHQSASFDGRKGERHRYNLRTHTRGSYMIAMSSCPSSTRSSPNHSGVLGVIAPNTTTLQVAQCNKTMYSGASISSDSRTKTSGIRSHNSNKNGKAHSSTLPSSNYTSVSTMHELHSAVQSAIAHCKESNKRLD